MSEIFRINFPYTTVYPSLGNLDLLPNFETMETVSTTDEMSGARKRMIRQKHKVRERKRRRRKERKREEGERLRLMTGDARNGVELRR